MRQRLQVPGSDLYGHSFHTDADENGRMKEKGNFQESGIDKKDLWQGDPL